MEKKTKQATEAEAEIEAKPKIDRFEFENERVQFRALLMTNPNYFGNLVESSFQPVQKIVGNTFYEQLTCVGYNPKLQQLEGHVLIKQPAGYKGNLCQQGGKEYVRFFVDYGSGWQDAGPVAFEAHNIPTNLDCAKHSEKPLAYVVSVKIEPHTDYCGHPVLPRVRAILSYEQLPTHPGFVPVWGNVVDQHIQITPRHYFLIDVLQAASVASQVELKLPPKFEQAAEIPIPLPDPGPLALAELAKMYGAAGGDKAIGAVEPHRFGMAEIQSVLALPEFDEALVQSKTAQFKQIGVNWSEVVAQFNKTQADVSYEEVECLGLDNNRNQLAATFRIKRPFGYNGDLCSHGSQEYVAFWADWNNTCEWTYLNTVSINVHDIGKIPSDGLAYTAVLPVNLDAVRQRCSDPKIVRVRAVLSWNALPSTTDPDDLQHWGNRMDAHVQVAPFANGSSDAGNIAIIGGIGRSYINVFGNGMTTNAAVFADSNLSADHVVPGRPCAFGGWIKLQGGPVAGHKYRVWAREDNDDDTKVKLAHAIAVTDVNGVTTTHSADSEGFFTYLAVEQNLESMLAYWYSAGDKLWEVQLEVATLGGVLVGSTAWLRVQLDNTAPVADIKITNGNCGDFPVGTLVQGTFVATDLHFGSYSLTTKPLSESPNQPAPSGGNAPTTFPNDLWSLTTNGMHPCGYVIELHVHDNTIVGSARGSHNYGYDDVGFCLS